MMKLQANFSPYNRKQYLATVAEKDRAIAQRLCVLLEAAFGVEDIQIYRNFPVVVRDMEWIAGFAMRVKSPIVYCCSAEALKELGAEMRPLMSGKSCLELRARGGVTLEEIFDLVARAYKIASMHGGMICEADRKTREKLRAQAAVGVATPTPKAASKKTTKQTTKKATKKPVQKLARANSSALRKKASAK